MGGELGKVLLVNTNQMKPPVVPLALDYLACALKKDNFEADLLDLCFATDWAPEIERYLAQNSVSAIAITLRNTDDCHFGGQEFFIPNGLKILSLTNSS